MLAAGCAPRKSSASGSSGNCAVVARDEDGSVLLSNDSQPEVPALKFTPEEWTAFLEGVRLSEFDLEPVAS
jgi:Domain of unknown function (DUF397)